MLLLAPPTPLRFLLAMSLFGQLFVVDAVGAPRAASMPATDYLRIVWNDGFKPPRLRATTDAVAAACTALAAALRPGSGPWGFGLFPNFGCYQGETLLAGAEGISPWTMLVEEGDQHVEIALSFDLSAAGREMREVGRVQLPSSPWTSHYGGPFFAPIQTPLPRLLS